MTERLLVVTAIISLFASLVRADEPLSRAPDWTQRLGSPLPLEEVFRDEDGASHTLRELIGSDPVILTFAYFDCPYLCPLVLGGLASALPAPAAGHAYRVLTVSIDPGETPQKALARKRATLAGLRPELRSAARWRFLTGPRATIARLTAAAGFAFSRDARSGQYAHPSGALVISPDGVIRQYLMGLRFDTAEISAALRRAERSETGSVVERILVFCLHYDPASTLVGSRVLLVLRAAGATCATMLACALAHAFRVGRRT